MIETKLGKINKVRLGSGGYDDAMFGVSFELGGQGWGVGDFWGTWSSPPSTYAKWTVDDQMQIWNSMVLKLKELMEKAKVNEMNKLVGIPVEITFENNTLKSWRVLEEVL